MTENAANGNNKRIRDPSLVQSLVGEEPRGSIINIKYLFFLNIF